MQNKINMETVICQSEKGFFLMNSRSPQILISSTAAGNLFK